ncbi:unnamed protein product (macronuclear) [Paramecium tetraurelia]|uniref:Uncharacterized protein n=1 Tax=Paramecium tetraurelia TaxID=5888 RepID=A0E4X0_PARTE|nr:uncharacterized protein GSPATT00023513001 [Paramecium tetraurelia]CAK90337.1 unnamed protein product [Paramecium tetraurelia]|eukprot:XP_001457734.1 hypothetical protein (macronuclear) [Paramecium tetraurelia strain d4-2]
MQTHHLLATLRIEKPTQKPQFLKILQDHMIVNCSNDQIDQVWEHCQEKECQQVIEVLQQQRMKSISLNSQKYKRNYNPQLKYSIKWTTNQQIIDCLEIEAERKLKDFINESCLGCSFTQVLQEKIVEFQGEKNKLNEEQGNKKAQQRLIERQKIRSKKLEQQIQFVLHNDYTKARAQAIYTKLLNTSVTRYKSTLNDTYEQRINQIMNTKFLL